MSLPYAQYKGEGAVLKFTAGADYSAGAVIQVGAAMRAGVVVRDVVSGAEGDYYDSGLFYVKKDEATAFALGQEVFWDTSDNELNTTGDFPMGVVVYAAAAASDAYCWVLLNGLRNAAGTPFLLTATVTGAGTVQIYNANCPTKLQILDAWIICTDANAGTLKLTDGTNDITNAITHGTTDKAIVRAGTIDDAYNTIAAGGTLNAVAATGGASIVCVLARPVT